MREPGEPHAVPGASGMFPEARDAEVDDVGALGGADEHVVLALQIAVRDTGCVHRRDRLVQVGEETLAVFEMRFVIAQRGSGDRFEHEIAVVEESERFRNSGDALEPLIDSLFPSQCRDAEQAQRKRTVRALDDDVAERARVAMYGRLVALAEQRARVRPDLGAQPGCERVTPVVVGSHCNAVRAWSQRSTARATKRSGPCRRRCTRRSRSRRCATCSSRMTSARRASRRRCPAPVRARAHPEPSVPSARRNTA